MNGKTQRNAMNIILYKMEIHLWINVSHFSNKKIETVQNIDFQNGKFNVL